MRTEGLRRNATLLVASVAVLVAATDTYVVVLALPDMLSGVGLGVDELQRATPIVTVFLLGYVAMLPLLGRLSDLHGRTRVLVGLLLVFSLGSLLTAVSTDLAQMVAGRFLQGVGGGGLVPVTLALVADRWEARRRGVPLGLVGAVQELGAVLGPLVGAAVLALADWRAIFWLNLLAGLLLVVALIWTSRSRLAVDGAVLDRGTPDRPMRGWLGRTRRDPIGAVLLVATATLATVLLVRPDWLLADVTFGWVFVPLVEGVAVTSPVWLAVLACAGGLVLVESQVADPLLDLIGFWRGLLGADLVGGLLIAIALGAVILAFATADPAVAVLHESWPVLLLVATLAAAGFAWRQRRARSPLLPAGSLSERGAWGAIVVSLLVGAALVVVLVDVPVFARAVLPGATQWEAAALLLRFLIALPFGAVLGGLLLRRFPPALVAATGMAGAAVGLATMSRWDASSVVGIGDDLVLGLCGFGFGLAVAPVNAALLASVRASVHGVGSAVLVVARMIGMLVGLSALTAVALRRFYGEVAALPSPQTLCPEAPLLCPEYNDALGAAVLTQLSTTFLGAAGCAALAAVLSAVLLRPRALA